MDSQRRLKPATQAHIAKLKQQFVESFSERIALIEGLMGSCTTVPPDVDALKAIRTEVHQLRGSSGLYEMPDLYSEFDALQSDLDVLLSASPAQLPTAETRQRLQRVLTLMRFPQRFLSS